MSWGIQTFDSTGATTLDISDKLFLVIYSGSTYVATGSVNNINIPGAVAGDYVIFTIYSQPVRFKVAWSPPTMTISSVSGTGTVNYIVVR